MNSMLRMRTALGALAAALTLPVPDAALPVPWQDRLGHRRRSLPGPLAPAVHRLPAYAPELNPVEGVWSWFKGTVRGGAGRTSDHPKGLRPWRTRTSITTSAMTRRA